MRIVIPAFLGLVFLVILSTFFGSWYTIDQGEKGVLTRNGAFAGVAEPGLGFKLPFVDGVTTLSTRTEIVTLDKLEGTSSDQQLATMRISVNYRLVGSEAERIYSQFGSEDAVVERLITPRVYQQVKNVFGRYTAQTTITQREKLNADIREALASSVKGPVVIEGVQLEDVSFSQAYNDAIEQRMSAEVEVQKSEQQAKNAVAQAKKSVTEAQAEADSNLAKARAAAEAVRIAGQAEADSIKAKGQALKENPALLQYQALGKGWDGVLPVTMVPGSALPFIGVK
jgi:regulator of protease activity HflC (stomatin/prohibitin superfamily)